MIAAADRAGVVFMVAQVLRFFAHYAKIRELIQGGEIGEVFYASAQRFSEPPQWAQWFRDAQASGGALFDLHIHDLDFLVSTFGLPQVVYARGSRSKSGAWDQVANVLSCGNATLIGEAGYRMPVGFPFTTAFRAVGTEGSVDYSFRVKGNVDKANEAENRLILYRDGHPPVRIDIEDPDPYRRQLEYFIHCVRHNDQPAAAPPRESRNAIAVLEAARRSLESGEQVRLQGSEFL
jgi:predicted dehydrogenase